MRRGETLEGLLREPRVTASRASSGVLNMSLNLPMPHGVVAIGLTVDALKSERSSVQEDVVKTAIDLSLSFSLEVQSILSYPLLMVFVREAETGIVQGE